MAGQDELESHPVGIFGRRWVEFGFVQRLQPTPWHTSREGRHRAPGPSPRARPGALPPSNPGMVARARHTRLTRCANHGSRRLIPPNWLSSVEVPGGQVAHGVARRRYASPLALGASGDPTPEGFDVPPPERRSRPTGGDAAASAG
jgi:hypothetical protein